MEHSGFVHSGYGCGCNKGKAQATGKVPPQSKADHQPKNETEKDVIEEAKKYSNPEVPAYNKLFAGTLLLVTLMIVTGGK